MTKRNRVRRWISALWALCLILGQPTSLLARAELAPHEGIQAPHTAWGSSADGTEIPAATAGPPTSLDIAGPGTMEIGETAVFTATASPTTVSVPITFTWELAGRRPYVVSVKGNQSTRTIGFAVEGTGYITVTAENLEGSVSWVRRVHIVPPPLPDLVPTDLTYYGTSVTYYLRNEGTETVTQTHTSKLYVDGVHTDNDIVTVQIAPGQQLKRSFSHVPICSGHSDEIRVYVDADGVIPESDDANNRRIETVSCDDRAPTIVRGPAAFNLAQTNAEIRWNTDEASDSVVLYGTRRGAFDLSASNTTLTTAHAVLLKGLRPGVTYEYKVRSTDAAGNTVESRPWTFETLALPQPAPLTPVVGLVRDPSRPGAYQLTATFDDASNVAQVEFLLNGKLIGVDYGNRLAPDTLAVQAAEPSRTAPVPQATQPIPSSAYRTTFVPYTAGYSRQMFFDTDHTVTAVVHTWDRATYATPVTLQIPSTSEPLRVEAHIEAPAPDHTIYINGDTTPAGTIVQVAVFAARYDWDCEYGALSTAADCAEVMHAVDYVNVYRGSDFITTLNPSNDQDYSYATTVDLSGLPAGSHQIRVLAVDEDAGDVWLDTFVEVVQRLPSLNVTRDVDRFGSRIRVRLTVENLPEASGIAKLMKVEDVVRSFQAATSHEPGYRVWADYNSWWGTEARECAVTIDFPDSPADLLLLDPGESVELEYWMVPILYEEDVDYEIGHKQVEVEYIELSGAVRTAAFDREELLLQSLVSQATDDADYLIVTTPWALMAADNNTNVDHLLMTMADLARLKGGVLGYLESPNPRDIFDSLIAEGGGWSARLDPEFETPGGGYLLIVGEQEIVPAWYDSGRDVDLSDHPYADTGGSGAPDLVVGRIIGNTAYDLRKPLEASIEVYLGEADFDRSKAVLFTGGGEGEQTFGEHIDEVQSVLYSDVGIAVHNKAKASDYHRIAEIGAGHSTADHFAAGNVLGLPEDQAVFGFSAADFVGFIDASDGTQLYWFEQDIGQDDVMVIGQVAPGPEEDVVLGDISSGLIRVFATGITSAFSPGPYGFGPNGHLATGDLDGDGIGEILYGSIAPMAQRLYVYDAAGAEVTGAGFDFDFNAGDGLVAGDVTGGSGAEIVIADAGLSTPGAIKVFSSNGTLLASKAMAYSASYNQIAIGRPRTSYGKEEIVLKTPGWIYVYRVDADEDTLVEKTRMYLPWMALEDKMALAAIDGDNIDEILLARPGADVIAQVDTDYCARFLPDVESWMPETDIFVYRGHGWAGGLGCVQTFPTGFGNARPLTWAPTCLSGNYEGNNDNGVAEAFFDESGAAYIGSTEVSYRDYNISAIKGFMARWDNDESVGDALLELERDRWSNSSDWRYWIYEYNLYGDPKFGAFLQPGLAGAATLQAAPTETLTLNLPALAVTAAEGIDYVTIPGGELWLEAGDAQVPLWEATYEYPPGVRVQEIAMDNRSALETHTGWILPLNTLATDSQYAGPLPATAVVTETDDAWVPDVQVPFTWRTMDNPDGSTTLSLAVYPFLYQALTTESEYYRHYDFTITTTTTALTITHLSPAQHVYEPGDWVDIDLQIANSDAARDVVVQGDIIADDGTIVSGLLLRSLHDLTGAVAFDPSWDSTGMPAGDYRIAVTLQDAQGTVLDQAEASFRLGLMQGELTSLTVDPESLAAGPLFDIDLDFRNTGSVPITGTAQVMIQPASGGETTAVITGTLAAVQPGGSATFSTQWDATGIASGDYLVHGVVKYDGRATPALTVDLQSSFRNYLPLVLRR